MKEWEMKIKNKEWEVIGKKWKSSLNDSLPSIHY
jgi:hypothetical protein